MITERQREFCEKRRIKIGFTYLLPRFGFTAYPSPSYRFSERIDTNPFTRSLDGSPVEVLSEVDGFYKVRFANKRPGEPDFYLMKHEMEMRGVFTMLLLRILLWPVFTVYNLLKKK